MGALVADGYVPHVQEQLNSRFIGEALEEMIGFQKEFKLFSQQHSLISSFTMLNISGGREGPGRLPDIPEAAQENHRRGRWQGDETQRTRPNHHVTSGKPRKQKTFAGIFHLASKGGQQMGCRAGDVV